MMGDKLGRSFKWWEGKDAVEAIKSCSAVKKKMIVTYLLVLFHQVNGIGNWIECELCDNNIQKI